MKRIILILPVLLLLTQPARASAQTTTITAGVGPIAVAVNPVTNKVYVANFAINPGEVTVIDGVTNTPATVTASYSPTAVAVNPVTNKIYVANSTFGGSVTVIDGVSNATATVKDTNAHGPVAIAINPETNKVYVGNTTSGNVTVIDGTTDVISATIPLQFSVPGGAMPSFIGMALNPVTNKIYVTNAGDGSVTVIDGVTHETKLVNVGSSPWGVAVNHVTGKIYVSNFMSSSVTVINGATDTVLTTITVGTSPKAVAVNPTNNMIYVANYSTGTVSIIDGESANVTTIAAGMNPVALTVNPVSNKVYVANEKSNSVTVIDEASASAMLAVGSTPKAVAVNMLTNTVYVANNGPLNPNATPAYGSVSAIPELPIPVSPLLSTIIPIPGDATTSTTPTFTITATSATGSPVRALYYQMDSIQGGWLKATPAGVAGSYRLTTAPLSQGAHTLYVFATDGSDATSINTGSQSSPLIGAIANYSFSVNGVPPVTYTVTPVNTAHGSITPTTPQVVDAGAHADFTITPENGYQLLTVAGCNATLIAPDTYRTAPVTGNCTIIPSFSATLLPVRIGATYYQDLQTAYSEARTGEIIQATQNTFSGPFSLLRNGIAVTVQGGYDVTYASQVGNSFLQGALTISSGSLVIDRLTIQ